MLKLEFKKELEQDSLNYYKNEMLKLTSFEHVSFKIHDFEGNSTKTLGLNEESLAALLELFNKMQAKKEAV